MPGGARMKMKDDVQQAVKAYFDGLAAKDVSSVPWADNATLRTPLNPADGESALIRGREAILDFFAGIFPALRGVKVVRHYRRGGMGRRTGGNSTLKRKNALRPRCLSCPGRRNR